MIWTTCTKKITICQQQHFHTNRQSNLPGLRVLLRAITQRLGLIQLHLRRPRHPGLLSRVRVPAQEVPRPRVPHRHSDKANSGSGKPQEAVDLAQGKLTWLHCMSVVSCFCYTIPLAVDDCFGAIRLDRSDINRI